MSDKLDNKRVLYLLARYIILLLVPLGNLYLFYFIFTPLTVYPTYLILKIFYQVFLFGTTLIVNGTSIHLISACIAGAAYYLLLILNLTTPMKPNVRFKSLLFLFAAFLVANILRIVVFSVAALNSYSWFGQIHALTWYLGSTIFVVCLWFINVRIFRTKSIPIYTDFKSILKSLK